ncbi:hypothetical protein OROGR_021031 [Orobanche gracilis]
MRHMIEALWALWRAAFPGEELHGLISEQWKEMGWQGKDPSTDFRGGGFISLENLLYFARNFPKSFQDLLRKQEGNRALWEYPFAAGGVNITFMLIQMLDLEAVKPRTLVGATFLKLLEENESAFDLLYCVAFKLMDHLWLAMHASYMDFNILLVQDWNNNEICPFLGVFKISDAKNPKIQSFGYPDFRSQFEGLKFGYGY